MLRRAWAVVGVVLAGWLAAGAADPPATVTNADGKEMKVTGVKFGAGTRRLAWLADPGGATDDARKGPLALELREPHSTTLKKGVVTFVPLGSIESIKYDYAKKVAAVAVRGLAEPLVGTLEYQGVNTLSFAGTADGKAATFSGGPLKKGGIKAVAFADAKPLPAKSSGLPWLVQIEQPKADNPTLRAGNLKFLYLFPGGVEVLTDTIAVRGGTSFKLDDAVTAFTPLAVDDSRLTAAVEVQAGGAAKVVLLSLQMTKDGKTGTLVGLLGDANAGWKLFPLHTIKSVKRATKE